MNRTEEEIRFLRIVGVLFYLNTRHISEYRERTIHHRKNVYTVSELLFYMKKNLIIYILFNA
jgi:hypothetical protein